MKITTAKIKRELIKNHGWSKDGVRNHETLIDEVLISIYTILKEENGTIIFRKTPNYKNMA